MPSLFFGEGGNVYRRVLLKLSGETLSGENRRGYNEEMVEYVVGELRKVMNEEVQMGIVIGAGNILRGKELNISSVMGDQMGMLGTVMNAIYLKYHLEKAGIPAVVVSEIVRSPMVKPIRYDDIEHYLQNGHIILFGGGTSNPFFTTDTAAALRAIEMEAQLLIKATKVDGVYDKDPKKFPDAIRFEELTFQEALNKKVKVMDIEAFSLCMRYNMPVVVMNFFERDNLLRTIRGERVGTLVHS